MPKTTMFAAVAAFALCIGGTEAKAQVLRPSAFSARSTSVTGLGDSVAKRMPGVDRLMTGSAEVSSPRRLRIKPILIGVGAGALLGAGAGAVLGAGACEGLHCSNRQEVTAGALIGAAVGGVFGLLLALPPKDH